LVVDDNPDNLVAIEAALGDIAPLVKACSGRDALRRLLERDFAVILLDVQMPALNGFETARLIRERERTRHVPIVFVTAFAHDDRDVVEAYRLGAVDFLFKPISAEVLRAKVSVFVDLQRRADKIVRQADLLREADRLQHRHQLEEQRSKLEKLVLTARLEEQRATSAELTHRAQMLAKMMAEREHIEHALREANAQLELTDRTKDEFLAVLAHELRNPLTPLVAGVELIEQKGNAELQRPVDAMKRQLTHLIRLVDDLLDVSRITSGVITLKRQPIAARAVVDQAVALATPLLSQREHDVSIDVPADCFVDGDPIRLTQILANLLSNAAKYTEPGGHIEIRAARDGDAATISVIDDGLGMTVEERETVFDLFRHGRASNSGLGVGLTLARRLAELHGGTLTADSAGPGAGSAFRLTLPAVDAVVQPAAAQGSGPSAGNGTPLRVVVIEDNEDVRELTSELLTTWGHTVEAASSGRSGIELVIAFRPDVAIVDIGLPDVDGYGVAREIRERLAESAPRLVAMTGYTQARDRRRAAEAGFHEHIAKPPKPELLRRAIKLGRS
jgi:signal transduction histidine kinase